MHRIGIAAAAGIDQIDGVSAAKQEAVRLADVDGEKGKGIRGIRGRGVLSAGRDAGKGGQRKGMSRVAVIRKRGFSSFDPSL